jgi:gliding motility-associated-like protein
MSLRKPTFVLVLLCCQGLFAQNQNSNWVFGAGATIKFQGGTASPAGYLPISTSEGCASVSAWDTGDLLFYSDGLSIFYPDGTTMENGTNISFSISLTGNSSVQGPLIVPFPGVPTKYLVFTVDAFDALNGDTINRIAYSEVDMTLNAGRGAVVPGQKRIVIPNVEAAAEMLAVAPKEDGTGYWVFGHLAESNDFVRISVTASGVMLADVTFVPWGSIVPRGCNICPIQASLVFSSDFSKAAMTSRDGAFIDIYDFDACTGVFTSYFSHVTLGTSDETNCYGLCFSPSGRYLFYTGYMGLFGYFKLWRVDLEETPLINFRRDVIATAPNLGQGLGTLQLGADNKLYVATGNDSLPVVSSPDAPLLSDIGYNYNGIAMPTGARGRLGLPQRVPDKLDPSNAVQYEIAVSATRFCFGNVLSLSIQPPLPVGVSVLWDLGNGTTANEPDFLYTYPAPGTFALKAILNNVSTCSGYNTLELTRNLQIDNCTELTPCIPILSNAFTPNNDGINDTWSPILQPNCTLVNYHLNVYNRWGELVFETNQPMHPWQPSGNVPEGVYAYVLQFKTDPVSAESKRTGTIALLR